MKFSLFGGRKHFLTLIPMTQLCLDSPSPLKMLVIPHPPPNLSATRVATVATCNKFFAAQKSPKIIQEMFERNYKQISSILPPPLSRDPSSVF